MARLLNIPYATNISKILEIKSDSMRCMKITDDGYEEIEIMLPALITVVKEINMPRLPSIKSMKNASKAEIEVVTFKDIDADENRLGLVGSPTQVKRTFVPVHDVNSVTLEGSAEDKAQSLAETLLSIKF